MGRREGRRHTEEGLPGREGGRPRRNGAPWDPLCCPSSLSPPRPHPQVWCRCITTIFNYFVVTNFFWMFVEGCYLHTAIVMTYSTEHLRKWLFLFIGWCEGPWSGGPLPGKGALLIKSALPPPLHLEAKDWHPACLAS